MGLSLTSGCATHSLCSSRTPSARNPCAQQGERFDRIDERVELDELPFLPEQAIELGRLERAEAAPEDEVLRGRDGRNRVELEESEPANGLQDAASGAVEQLRAN